MAGQAISTPSSRHGVDGSAADSESLGDFPLRKSPFLQQPMNLINHRCC
jgi:hypothetical protein